MMVIPEDPPEVDLGWERPRRPPMTVRTLIMLLEKFDPETDVVISSQGEPKVGVWGVSQHERLWEDEDDLADGAAIIIAEHVAKKA